MEDRHSRLLQLQLRQLNVNFNKQQVHLRQQMNKFLRSQTLPTPTIIIERAASLEAEGGYYESERPITRPHYMSDLKCRQRSAGMIRTTIDLYGVKSRKKLNLWEEALQSDEMPTFECKVHPSQPLSTDEQDQLKKGWLVHRLSRSRSANNALRGSPLWPRNLRVPSETPTFITELALYNQQSNVDRAANEPQTDVDLPF